MREQEHHIEEFLPEYLSGSLPLKQQEAIEAHVKECASCSKAYGEQLKLEEELQLIKPATPRENLRSTVYSMIEEEKKGLKPKKHGKQVFIVSWQGLSRLAAAVALVAGGYWLGIKNAEIVPPESGQVAEMKQELGEIKEMLLIANLKAQYPSERIQAVNQVETVYQQVDTRLISALVNTLNTDASPNVRLAAANALQKFAQDNSTVRAELVRSLEFQSEPIVQIALINMMVELEEKSAINKLRSLIDRQETLPEVKKQAEIGIEVLT